jgi:2'-5' RNA ligase
MPEHTFLWLLLSGSVHDRFATLIHTLSRRLGTPRFIPHITLAGSIDLPADEIVSRAANLATRLASIPLRLTDVGWTEEYYRCLFIRAEHSPELLAAHHAACTDLGRAPDAEFMPHLSLVYGNLTEDRKAQIVNDIGQRYDIATDANRIGLCLAAGSPEQWRLIRTFALTGQSMQDNRL